MNSSFIMKLLKELKVKRVDWIKIDVEGAEYEVLKGLKKTINQHKPRIITEVFKENLTKVAGFLKREGYRVKIIPNSVEGDILYLYCEPTFIGVFK